MPYRPRKRYAWIPTAVAVILGGLFLSGYQPDIPLTELKHKYADATSMYVDVFDMPVHYRDQGRGPVLLLLHGSGSSLHTWDDWVTLLARDFRVIRMDLPGFGLTGPDPTDDYSVARYVEFVNAFASKIGVTNFHLAGNSLGGRIAWNYALVHPERVDRLILIDAAGYPRDKPNESPLVFKLAKLPVINWFATVMTPRSLTESSLQQVFADQRLVTPERVDRYFELMLRPGNRAAFVERANDAVDDRNGDHRNISQPTLILWGVEDRWIPLADGRGFADDIANSRFIAYPGVGHLPMEEIPGPTARAAMTFLTAP